ncbi:MAG TPA: TonB family protein [Terriglobales bacterium]|jgi:protein TonB|nr:TonB family protein [Terriglobales bacterium]
MFEDSLIESGGKLKTKRAQASFVAFIFEGILIGIMVLIPLLITEALPKSQLMMSLVAPPPPPPPPPPPAVVHIVKQVQTNIINDQLRTPTKIPKKIEMIKEDAAPPPMTAGVVGGISSGPGQVGGVIGGIISSTPVAVPKVATPQRIRVSQGVTQGLKIRDVKPNYPPLARQARIQGSVLLQAVISKDGSIEDLKVISGHPMLVPAAIDAVKQWKYKPYVLNGEPVVVDTQITVNFTLGG